MFIEKGQPLLVFLNVLSLKTTEEELWCCIDTDCNAKIYVLNSVISRKSVIDNHSTEESVLSRQRINIVVKRKAIDSISERHQKLIMCEIDHQKEVVA